MKNYIKGLFGAITIALLAFTGVRAQSETATATDTVRLEHVIIDNSITNAAQVFKNSFDASLVVAANDTRSGAKPAASLETFKSGQIRLGQIFPCVLPTPGATGYFEERAKLLAEIRGLKFPSSAVSRLLAEYVSDASGLNGRQVVGAIRIVGPVDGKISAKGLRIWCELIGVPGSAISYAYGELGYTDFRIGIDYGPDRIRDTADDIVITSGDGSIMVDEIIFVGLGQSLNNSLAQVKAAFAANKSFVIDWLAQVREPANVFNPDGDVSNVSQKFDQNEGAPAPIIVVGSVKNPGNFPWEVWSSPSPSGPFTRLNGDGVILPGAMLLTPPTTTFFRFSRP